ncbi:MAG: HNH endonuclease [Gammaproteobacteria bacterium]|nr:HNH endonuclease [Gammaproteobacteria bacterium]
MEATLGRSLLSGEVVHHINKVKDDDRPENLELFSNTTAHSLYHGIMGDLGRRKKGM